MAAACVATVGRPGVYHHISSRDRNFPFPPIHDPATSICKHTARRKTKRKAAVLHKLIWRMDDPRHQAFQKLRPPCVNLSSVVLKFRAKQTPVKTVLGALDDLHKVVEDLGHEDALDEKLAEYIFFPLSHVFNQSQWLSSRCLEVAVRCLQVLVTRGWRVKLAPEMGKQLLIMLTLLAGGSPAKSQIEAPADELKVAAFECLSSLTQCIGRLQRSKPIFDEIGARTIVDQCIYVLLEAITDSPSDHVQLAAAQALSAILDQVKDRVVLASLLPRTVSALTKASQPSTRATRTYKVLQLHLEILTKILCTVLNDDVAVSEQPPVSSSASRSEPARKDASDTMPVLDKSWLQATSAQVKVALATVAKLRNHDRIEVRQALVQLASTMIDQCPRSLSDSIPLLVETLVVLANDRDSSTAFPTLKRLATSEAALAETLKSSFHRWTASLPRIMQASDDRPKERVLQQISTTFEVLSEIDQTSDILDNSLAMNLVESVAAAIQSATPKSAQGLIEATKTSLNLLQIEDVSKHAAFDSVVLHHGSQRDSGVQLQNLIARLGSLQNSDALIRLILDRVTSSGSSQLAAIWLTLNFLRQERAAETPMDRFLDLSGITGSPSDSRPYLVSDLYSLTVSELLETHTSTDVSNSDWRLTALALESLVLQADQLGPSYRPELIATLYPVLSLLGASEPQLRMHAMTTLNLLATACDYPSTSNMLIQNVDYLINSIALKLNTFDVSPQAPKVLLMMIRLCGEKLIPYLDDLIGDVFAALDSFHGYPRLVELLFEVLATVVDEGAKRSSLAITNRKEAPTHRKQLFRPSTVDDIMIDLRSHSARKRKADDEHLEPMKPAPHRPWKDALDGPHNLQNPLASLKDEVDDPDDGDEDEKLPPSEKEQPLSISHKLLLQIAEFTPYHLSSPSPGVRLTILQLLTRIATPLSADENTFLPLINAVWPALVPRLFADSHADDSNEPKRDEPEPVYIVKAAAETASALCVGAGDFMASRIEDVFPNLERLYQRVWGNVAAKRQREAGRGRGKQVIGLEAGTSGTNLRGPVDLDLRIVKSPAPRTALEQPAVVINQAVYQGTHSVEEQILDSLVALFVAILGYVHITDDMGDSILSLLAPIMDEPGREATRDALDSWNSDAVWLVREQKTASVEESR